MPITVQLPEFNESKEIIIDGWFKKVGDRVEVGDDIVVLKVDGHRACLVAFHYGTLTEVLSRMDKE
jgi:pyruvate/2-oxoglutarate dehydrogenase complex dihydrolipoamide acyltransferase (E2) component